MTEKKPLGLVLDLEVFEDGEQAAEHKELRSGDLCPKCREGRMDYDGLLNLSCQTCGYARGGCFT